MRYLPKTMMMALSIGILFTLVQCSREIDSISPITDGSLIGSWNAVVRGMIWQYRIGYQTAGEISGAKVIDTIIIPFTGSYDVSSREIVIQEYNTGDSLSGEFRGEISEDLQSIIGDWTAYLTGNSITIGIGHVDTNYNRIIIPRDGNLYIYLESSEAFYHGALGLAQPDSVELCEDYKNCIGDTLSLGHFRAGTELVFYIYINNTGHTYYSLNYDHAIIVKLTPGEWLIKWEDSENIDRDFNDLIMRVVEE